MINVICGHVCLYFVIIPIVGLKSCKSIVVNCLLHGGVRSRYGLLITARGR